MDSDSKLDLDDVAAGHPVAMRELAELRGALEFLYDKWENGVACHETDDFGETIGNSLGNAFTLTKAEEDRVLALIPKECAAKNLPAPGVAQEPEGFEEWHRANCPNSAYCNPVEDPWLPGRVTDRFADKSCHEVYEAEHPPEGKPSPSPERKYPMLTAAELRELEARATGGPWEGEMADGGDTMLASVGDGHLVAYLVNPADAEFLALLRNHAKFLAAALELGEACIEYHDSGKKVDRRHEALSRFRAQREGS